MTSAMSNPHAIRFRKAWTLECPPGTPAGRLDLPAAPLQLTQPFVLIRQWSLPPRLPAHASLSLELAQLPGLRSVRLNGATLSSLLSPTPLPNNLPDRSTLILEVDPSTLTDSERSDWGHIALLVTTAYPDSSIT